MKLKLSLVFCVLFVTGTISAQTGVDQWQRYTVEGGEFSVKLPAPPRLTSLSVVNPHAGGDRLEQLLVATAAGLQYGVYAYENPKSGQSLKQFIAEQTANDKSKLIAKREFKKDGFAAYEYKWVNKDRPRTAQFIATERHLYRFHVDGADADDPAAKEFFSSILLGKNLEGTVVSDEASVRDERIFAGKEVDQKARMTRYFPPEYSEEARKNNVTGTVVLKVVVSSNGQITRISVVSGLPFGLTERAIAAARKIQFVPAVKDGKNVSMWMQLEYNFNEP